MKQCHFWLNRSHKYILANYKLQRKTKHIIDPANVSDFQRSGVTVATWFLSFRRSSTLRGG